MPLSSPSSTVVVHKLLGDQWGEPELPYPDRLTSDCIPALEQQSGDIAEAELVAKPPRHQEHYVRGALDTN